MKYDLGKMAIELRELDNRMDEIDEEWAWRSHGCKFHSSTVGDCDHSKNKSCSMTSCNWKDCPLGKEHEHGGERTGF